MRDTIQVASTTENAVMALIGNSLCTLKIELVGLARRCNAMQ
jgi:hypothetical protein